MRRILRTRRRDGIYTPVPDQGPRGTCQAGRHERAISRTPLVYDYGNPWECWACKRRFATVTPATREEAMRAWRYGWYEGIGYWRIDPTELFGECELEALGRNLHGETGTAGAADAVSLLELLGRWPVCEDCRAEYCQAIETERDPMTARLYARHGVRHGNEPDTARARARLTGSALRALTITPGARTLERLDREIPRCLPRQQSATFEPIRPASGEPAWLTAARVAYWMDSRARPLWETP